MDIATIDRVAEAETEESEVLQPSKTLVAQAIPVEDGWLAQFSAPGLIPRYVTMTHSPDVPHVFDTKVEAEEAARKAAFGIFNKPRQTQSRGKNDRYEKMSGPEFAVALAETGVGLSLFAYVYGTSVDRAQAWIDSTENVPHPARVLLALFKDSARNVDIAEKVTDSVTTARRPPRDQR